MFIIRRTTLDDLDAFLQLRLQLFRETGDLVSDEVPPDLLEATQIYHATVPPQRCSASSGCACTT